MADRFSTLATPGTELRVEPATIEDLPELTSLVMDLLDQQGDFDPDRHSQAPSLL